MGEWDGLEARLKDLGDGSRPAGRRPPGPGEGPRTGRPAAPAAVGGGGPDRGRHPRLGRGRRVRGHVPTGAAHTEPGRRSHQHADPESRSRRRRSALAARGSRAPRPSRAAAGSRCHRPTRRAARYSPDPTPESPTPSETSSPSPTETSEEPEPEPTSTWTEDPDAHPTSEPTRGRGRWVDADRPAAERRDRRRLTPVLATSYALRRPCRSVVDRIDLKFDRPTMQPPPAHGRIPLEDPVDERGATMHQRRVSRRWERWAWER